MHFGHNSDVTARGVTFHVQTEDRGSAQALIDTTVYYGGRVLHRRTNNYLDLLPLNPEREQALLLRVDDQHRAVIDEIRAGKLPLHVPPKAQSAAAAPPLPTENADSSALHLELVNAKNWLSGKHARLQIAVRNPSNQAVEGAAVSLRVEGAAAPAEFSAVTGPSGHVQFEFDMPRLASPEPALLIQAFRGAAQGRLHFHLRAKPRVPSAS